MLFRYQHLTLSLILALAMVASNFIWAKEPDIYRVHLLVKESPNDAYLTLLLQAVLEASKKPNETIKIEFNDIDLSQARWIAELKKGLRNEIVWTITTKERERLMRPIKIPLMRGLFGYRLLAVRPDSIDKFAHITTLQQLATLPAGLNPHWPDAATFKDNHLPIVEGTFASNLYRMLSAGRFDYFPRGALELTDENTLIKENGIEIEPSLLIYYPSALYFFVNKDNRELAHRLEKGLNILLRNGEFDRLFYNHPSIVAALAAIKNRRIIRLKNTQLPNNTQEFPPEYYNVHQPTTLSKPPFDNKRKK